MTSKIAIIGAGNVGATLAYTLFLKGLYHEIVLLDINQAKAEGEALDMKHGKIFASDTVVRAGTYDDLKDVDALVITASASMAHLTDRNQLLGKNIVLFKSLMAQVKPVLNPNAIVIVISNPCDSIAFIVKKLLNTIPANHVIGSGCVLDSSRFRQHLSDALGVDAQSIQAYCIGEHGNSEVTVLSSATVGSYPLLAYSKANGIALDPAELNRLTMKDGFEVQSRKGCTDYGVALSTTRILEAILGDENSVLPVSAYQIHGPHFPGDYYMSLPCLIGKDGVKAILPVQLDAREMASLKASVDLLKANAKIVLESL